MSHAASTQSLELHGGALRSRKLLAERERLLGNLRKKREERDRVLAQVRVRAERGAAEATVKGEALRVRLASACDELRALFDELLAPGRLSKRAHREVARVRRMLEEDGVFESSSIEEDSEDDDFDPFGGATVDADEEGEELASVPAVALGKGHDSLRSTFRRVALGVHPDRAVDDDDRERRTRLMKDVTKAYDEGDLARLLEIERDTTLREASTEEPRIEELQKINRELRQQLRRLQREIREVSAGLSAMQVPMEMLAVLAEAEVEDLERTRDFVRAFRDGKITLARFLEGPDEDDENDLVEDDVGAALAEILNGLRTPAPRKRGGGRKSSR